jgi:CheY-like chemotaxis protein
LKSGIILTQYHKRKIMNLYFEPTNPPVIAILDQDDIFHYLIAKSLPHWEPSYNFKVVNFSGVYELCSHLIGSLNNPENTPDIILVEINLTPLDSWVFLDFYDRIKDKLKKKPAIYIVSNSILEIDKKRALSYSFVKNYIEKPFTKKDFEEINSSLQSQLVLR